MPSLYLSSHSIPHCSLRATLHFHPIHIHHSYTLTNQKERKKHVRHFFPVLTCVWRTQISRMKCTTDSRKYSPQMSQCVYVCVYFKRWWSFFCTEFGEVFGDHWRDFKRFWWPRNWMRETRKRRRAAGELKMPGFRSRSLSHSLPLGIQWWHEMPAVSLWRTFSSKYYYSPVCMCFVCVIVVVVVAGNGKLGAWWATSSIHTHTHTHTHTYERTHAHTLAPIWVFECTVSVRRIKKICFIVDLEEIVLKINFIHFSHTTSFRWKCFCPRLETVRLTFLHWPQIS